MPSIDIPIEQLRQYKPQPSREPDFQSFWDAIAREARTQPLNAELIPYGLPARGVEAFAVRFDGFESGRIAGWYVRPASAGKFAGVCLFHGYGGRAPRPLELIHLASQGICALSMDCRGQNGQSTVAPGESEGHFLGWMTQGIRDPRTYVYRSIYADALRAVELLAAREEVDPARLAVTGLSQGGGISLATAALSDRVALVLPDVPFLCDFRRAIGLASAGPYLEIPGFLKVHPQAYEQAMRTLSYFDVANLASRIRCRAVVLACLWDEICPASTIFGAYNQITSEKQIEVYPFHGHETPYEHQEMKFRLLIDLARQGSANH